MTWQPPIDIYRDPSELRALTCNPSETAYRFPTGARGCSLITIPAGSSAKLAVAYWMIEVVAKSPDVGIELVALDPTGTITTLAEITGFTPKPSPQRGQATVTREVQALLDATALGVPTGREYRQIGHRVKGDGVSAPLLYMSSLLVQWA